MPHIFPERISLVFQYAKCFFCDVNTCFSVDTSEPSNKLKFIFFVFLDFVPFTLHFVQNAMRFTPIESHQTYSIFTLLIEII